jgi:hypothetical protein
MTLGRFGTGFLNSDPRKGQHPTGGSIHAAQGKDTSVLITGNPEDSFGYGNKDAFSTQNESYVPNESDPNSFRRTAAETRELRESRGVAKSHENMGSLAVDFRKSEEGKRKIGEQTETSKRATKILDARAAAEYQRNVTGPAEWEAAKFRAQAAGAKAYMDQFTHKMDAGSSIDALFARGKRGGGGVAGGMRMPTSGPNTNKLFAAGSRSGLDLGPNHSKIMAQTTSDFNSIRGEDPSALAGQRAHAQAPGTQAKSAAEMANAQSASGRATPIEMAQAMASQSYRNNPNKP